MTPEGKVKDKVKQYLKGLGAWFFMPVPTGRGVAGVPDFVACVPVEITADMVGQRVGMFVGIETKAPGKERTVTPLQQRQIDAIRAAGGLASVVTSAEQICLKHTISKEDKRP